MKRPICLAALLLATTLIGAVPAAGQALPPPTPIPGDGPEDAKLKRLFYDSDGDDGDEATDVSLPSVAAHHAHATGRRLVIQ